MDQDMPANELAVLPSVWQIPSLDAAALAVSDVSFQTKSSSLPLEARDREGPLQSSPDLYLLHATFLI